MHLSRRWSRIAGLAVLTAAGLVACGGGNDPLPPKASISRVYVMGDSLADVGTFGYKFTVQDSSNPKGFQIWPQLVANTFGLNGAAQCNVFTGTQTFNTNGEVTSETYTTNTTCTNYAIGDGRIVVPPSSINPSATVTNPRNIVQQLQKRFTLGLGNYSTSDLVLIDGGGNDAADLVGAYLQASTAPQAYFAFLRQQLTSDAVNGFLSNSNSTDGAAQAAGAYMQALAQTFHDQIKAQVLDKGAVHVAILNIPDITLTPRFQALLAGVAQSQPSGGAAVAQALQDAIRLWIGAYNTTLATLFAGDNRVTIAPFYADLTDEIQHPQTYSLSNVNDTACPAAVDLNGNPILDNSGLPTYDFQTCTSDHLDTTYLPTGKAAGWWKSYAFSDGFHPTPYGHQLLAASVSRALARAGWL